MGPGVSPTRELAGFLAGRSGRLEERLLRRAVDALVDTVGCTVFGAAQPWSQAAISHALASGGNGPATVIGASCIVSSGRSPSSIAAR